MQLGAGHPERLEAVTEAPGAPGGGPAVPTDVDRQLRTLHGFGVAGGVLEVEELAVIG